MTFAWRGQGTRVQYALLASGAVDTDYHLIEECRITNDQDRSNELDASNHDTPGRFMEYVAGMRDVQWSIGGNWLPQRQSHQDVNTMYNNGTPYMFRIDYPQVTPHMRWQLTAIIVELSHTYDANTISSWTGRLRPAGAPTLVTYT